MALQADAPKKRTFRKFSFRGVDLDALLDMSDDAITAMLNARQRRKKSRHGVTRKPRALLKRLRKAVCCPLSFGTYAVFMSSCTLCLFLQSRRIR